ncbi:MAG: protein translocase subunit SecD [Nocardiopsaceae bacterium]|nr:protein translocase subunit SecD [Nocardiopsaceae bacterium]
MAPPRRTGPRPVRALAALAVLILIMLIAITGSDTLSPGKWSSQFKVGLGLDLSSGTQVTLRAYTTSGKPPTAGDMAQAINILESRVNGTGNTGATVQQQGGDQINVSVPGKSSEQVINLISSTARLRVRPVLLAQPYIPSSGKSSSGSNSSANPSGSASPSASPSSSASSKPSPSSTSTAKTSALTVPDGATPSPAALAKAGSSASPPASPAPSPSGSPSSAGPYGDKSKVNAATMKLFNKLVCKPGPNANTVDNSWKQTVGYTNEKSQWDITGNQIVSCDAKGTKYVLGPAVFTGPDVTSVSPQLEQNSTSWVVAITLNSQATKAWGQLTSTQASKYYPGAQSDPNDEFLDMTGVVLDGNVVSAPETTTALTGGNFQIQGGGSGFTEQQATNLSNVIKYGQLPLNFQRLDVTSISPTLGHDSLVAGLIAGAIGLAVVVVYLLCYYRGLGLVSVSSLLIAALLAYLAVVLLSRYQSFTMELAGIAGLIVAIGITADSFIVFFERLRDEVRDGKQLRPAVESGWRRARRTVLVSDTVSFLAAVLLYQFATSDVQGFAYTLGLTTLIDVLVVFMFTKPMVTLLAGTKFFGGGHPWSGLDPRRLGSRAPWRSGIRRQRRTTRTREA